jgi:hypothetical protein
LRHRCVAAGTPSIAGNSSRGCEAYQRIPHARRSSFTSAGLLAGPALGLIDLRLCGEAVKLLAETTLTLVLFAEALAVALRGNESPAPSPRRP